MQLFASTTFHGTERTRVTDVVSMLCGLPLEGIELGSTHVPQDDVELLAIPSAWRGRLLTHNFFPPARDDSIVLNIASTDKATRFKSVAHCEYCIDMAAKLGAELYTVHPGFLAAPLEATSRRGESYYDFRFSDQLVSHEHAFSALIESLSLLLDHATQRGVTLAIETEGSVTKQGVLLMERPEQYADLFAVLPGVRLNFNLAHTMLASRVHGFSVADFIRRFAEKFAAVELSHNDGQADQHAPFVPGSYVFSWLDKLPDVPWIMEFRGASTADLENSARLIRAAHRLSR